MKRDLPKIWTNQKQNFFHIAYYLDNFNSQDCGPQAVKQNSKLLDFGCNQHESAEESSIFLAFIAWLCPKAIKNQWLEISPLLRHHRTYFHFLIVLKTLASEISLSSAPLGNLVLGSTGLGSISPWPFCCLTTRCPGISEWDTHQASRCVSDGKTFEQFSSSTQCGLQTAQAPECSEAELMLVGTSS